MNFNTFLKNIKNATFAMYARAFAVTFFVGLLTLPISYFALGKETIMLILTSPNAIPNNSMYSLAGILMTVALFVFMRGIVGSYGRNNGFKMGLSFGVFAGLIQLSGLYNPFNLPFYYCFLIAVVMAFSHGVLGFMLADQKK